MQYTWVFYESSFDMRLENTDFTLRKTKCGYVLESKQLGLEIFSSSIDSLKYYAEFIAKHEELK